VTSRTVLDTVVKRKIPSPRRESNFMKIYRLENVALIFEDYFEVLFSNVKISCSFIKKVG